MCSASFGRVHEKRAADRYPTPRSAAVHKGGNGRDGSTRVDHALPASCSPSTSEIHHEQPTDGWSDYLEWSFLSKVGNPSVLVCLGETDTWARRLLILRPGRTKPTPIPTEAS